ncbi:hypothetical protein VTL71DRAFT_8342 [Oculimacula yallundae]|uniref:G-protein coupled receptors family 2 profile 2 domain-containing protein n=1 Tax=Oculimacula yallundae TaxID=86028 RepID=A0ABR4CXC0_9HELO
MFAKDLSEKDLWRLSVIERTGSTLSLLAIAFIVSTFLLSANFQKPITRLIFYASVGNIFTCIATMISRAAIAGTDVTQPQLCKVQAFLIQVFMPADALWAFVMGLNLYLTFYNGYRADQLFRMEKYYIAFCYGLPFIVAFPMIFVSVKERGLMYGNATLWCWISGDWDHFRMYLFYIPVWVVCLGTILIYIRLVYTLIINYLRLRYHSQGADPDLATYNTPITGTRTTDITVRSEPAAQQPAIPLQDMSGRGNLEHPRSTAPSARSYNCHISGGNASGSGNAGQNSVPTNPLQKYRTSMADVPVRSSPNPNRNSVRLSFVPSIHVQPIHQRQNVGRANEAMKIMGIVAVFFFFIQLLTWIPSSANRLYSVVHPKKISLTLEYMAACVLPMQGFWNCVIYVVINRESCMNLLKNIRERRQWTAIDVGASLKTAFAHHRPVSTRRESTSRTSTAVDSRTGSRPFTARVGEDDSITLIEDRTDGSQRPGSSRPNTGRFRLDRDLDLDDMVWAGLVGGISP